MRARWRLDRKLTATMIDDFIHDPVLAAKVIIGWDLPPHQQIRLMDMWTTHLTIDDSGFSSGKTATFAIAIALRSILFSERKTGIVSGTFRQSKIIFGYFDSWYNSSPIFRYCLKHARGKPKITHGTDAWEAQYRGDSIVRALPPGFIGDSTKDKSRLRSERWHDGYFDEWTTFDITIMTRTLFGRVTALNRNPDDPIRQNHIHLASTPGFTSYPSYEVIRSIDKKISMGSKNYSRFTSNYRHVPKRKKWVGFVDYKTIHTMQTTNPEGVVKSEIDGVWQSDSLSYYSYNGISSCRMSGCPIMFKRRDASDIYIAGFDSARGGVSREKQESGEGDDFSISVIRIPGGYGKKQHVLTIRKNNVTSQQMAGVVYRLNDVFNFKYIVYDPGGGGAFVADDLKSDYLVVNDKRIQIIPIVDRFDFSIPASYHVLIPFKRGFQSIDKTFDKVASDSIIINKLHKYVSGQIANKKIALQEKWNGWPVHYGVSNLGQMRKFLNASSTILEKTELACAEMDLAALQLVSVDVARKNGAAVIDSYGMYKFTSRYKKDSAYGLIYAMCGCCIYEKELEEDKRESTGKLAISMGAY